MTINFSEENCLSLKMKNAEAKELFRNGLNEISNSINEEISSLSWEIEKLTKQVEIESREKEKFALMADILFRKLMDDYKEDENKLREFVFKRYDEIMAEREKENE